MAIEMIPAANTLRIEALSQAVRVSLAQGGNEPDEATVERAKAFEAFLTKVKD